MLVDPLATQVNFHGQVQCGNTFEVYTDDNCLIYVFSSAKLDALGPIWVNSLANYILSTFFKTGKSNAEVDALSRIP